MSILWPTVGLIACIYLMASNEPGSFLFIWGVVCAVFNVAIAMVIVFFAARQS